MTLSLRDAPVYLSAIAHDVGEPVPMREIADEVLSARLDLLREQGLRDCRVSDRTVVGLAAASARRTLGLLPDGTVDAIVFCTDTSPRVSPTKEVWDLLVELDMPRTPVTFVSGSGCGNLAPGLGAARAMVLLEGRSAVLVVTSDAVHDGVTRYLANGQTVLSDGAASCVVSARPVGPAFRVSALAGSFRADIGTIDQRPIVVARATTEGVRAAVEEAVARTSIDDFRYVLTGNYGHSARQFLAAAVGVPVDRVRCPLLAETGHVFAADVLLTIRSLVDSGRLGAGDDVLAVTMSPRSWSVAALTCTGASS